MYDTITGTYLEFRVVSITDFYSLHGSVDFVKEEDEIVGK